MDSLADHDTGTIVVLHHVAYNVINSTTTVGGGDRPQAVKGLSDHGCGAITFEAGDTGLPCAEGPDGGDEQGDGGEGGDSSAGHVVIILFTHGYRNLGQGW